MTPRVAEPQAGSLLLKDPATILVGDAIEQMLTLPDRSIHMAVTSPPYWGLRCYGVDGQYGLEATPAEWVAKMLEVFRQVRRVLRDDGTLWLNVGDVYAGSSRGGYPGGKGTLEGSVDGQDNARVARGSQLAAGLHEAQRQAGAVGRAWVPPPSGFKRKDLMLMPWRLAIALQEDGWFLRSAIAWAKRAPVPESVQDRPTSSWEPIFLLAKNKRYFYDAHVLREADLGTDHPRNVVEPPNRSDGHMPSDRGIRSAEGRAGLGRNQRNVWHLTTDPYPGLHYAAFPREIPRRAILAGTSERGCCEACGAPWKRLMAKTSQIDTSAKGSTFDVGKTGARDGGERTQAGPRFVSRFVGWRPGCQCKAEVVPCVVLDPFLGSGTTLAVARQLGRAGIGIELNPKYVQQARERIGKAEKPSTFNSGVAEHAPLFLPEAGE